MRAAEIEDATDAGVGERRESDNASGTESDGDGETDGV
jgi:hypothetical protein